MGNVGGTLRRSGVYLPRNSTIYSHDWLEGVPQNKCFLSFISALDASPGTFCHLRGVYCVVTGRHGGYQSPGFVFHLPPGDPGYATRRLVKGFSNGLPNRQDVYL